MRGKATLVSMTLVLSAVQARADMIPMRDFIHLKRGMSEAEILYRVGPSDHESVYSDRYHQPLRKIWYYIPAQRRSSSWITEIVFNGSGVVQSLERYRARY